jgi:predicted DNA-binding transcriptional regulator AlpA
VKYSRDQLWTPEEFAAEYGISEATLADWRCDGTGPPYMELGRIVFYPQTLVDDWLDSQLVIGPYTGDKNVTKEKVRELALPVPTHEKGVQRRHRFGRHATKHEGSRED